MLTFILTCTVQPTAGQMVNHARLILQKMDNSERQESLKILGPLLRAHSYKQCSRIRILFFFRFQKNMTFYVFWK